MPQGGESLELSQSVNRLAPRRVAKIPGSRRVSWAIIVFLIVMLSSFFSIRNLLFKPSQVVYRGKSPSQWLDAIDVGTKPAGAEIRRALRVLGPDALPTIMQYVNASDPPLVGEIKERLGDSLLGPAIQFAFGSPGQLGVWSSERKRIQGFRALETFGVPRPELNDRSDSGKSIQLQKLIDCVDASSVSKADP